MSSLHPYFIPNYPEQEPLLPSHKCEMTGEPIYRGVLIEEEYFGMDVFESGAWKSWYKVYTDLEGWEIDALEKTARRFRDNGLTLVFE